MPQPVTRDLPSLFSSLCFKESPAGVAMVEVQQCYAMFTAKKGG